MNITFAPRGILQIDDANIVFRNFSGEARQYNREGDRNFAVVIPEQELYEALSMEGWNVKRRPPRNEDEEPFMYMPVKIKFSDRGPNVYLETNGKTVKLSEETVNCLDDIEINSCDMDIRPYDWDINGKKGRTAYLQSIKIVQRVDRFAVRNEDNQLPF